MRRDMVVEHDADQNGNREDKVHALREEGADHKKLPVEVRLLEQGGIGDQNMAVHRDDVREELPEEVAADQIEKVIVGVPAHHHAKDEVVDERREKGNEHAPEKANRRRVVLQLEVLGDQNPNLVPDQS